MTRTGGLGLGAALMVGMLVSVPVAGSAEGLASSKPWVNVIDRGDQATVSKAERSIRRQILLQAGEQVLYDLVFSQTEYRDQNPRPGRREARMGVEAKSGGQGWYPGNTFVIEVDGVDLNKENGRWQAVRVLDQGTVTLIEATLVHVKVSVRLRLALAPDRDAMDVEATLLRPAAREFAVRLACFPAYYTVWNKRRGDRWVVTAARSVEEPREPGLDMNARSWKETARHMDLDPAKEDWLFYYDRFFNDPAGGRGQGVCGLACRTGDLGALGLEVGNYQITTVLKAKPGASTLRFTLWHSPAVDYGPALAAFPALAARAQSRLSDPLRFAPAMVRDFNETAEHQTLARLKNALPPSVSAGANEVSDLLRTAVRAVSRLQKASDRERILALSRAEEAVRDYRIALTRAQRKVPHPLRFLVLAGRDYPEWRVQEAAQTVRPPMILEYSYFIADYQGDRLTRFPATETQMMGYDGVILLNVSAAALNSSAQRLLQKFIRSGGGLIVAGGFYAYGSGGYGQSVLAELLPVTTKGRFDVQRLAEPAVVGPGDTGSGLPSCSMADLGVVLWLQEVTVKPGAKTALTAKVGDEPRPFLTVWPYGQGRVAALAGTVYGVPPANQPAFWDHPAWAAYLADLMAWSAGREGGHDKERSQHENDDKSFLHRGPDHRMVVSATASAF